MSLAPSLPELIARARADLRMGVPIVLRSATGTSVAIAAENLSNDRLISLASLGDVVLAITARRAETLKAPAYDNNIARFEVPKSATKEWIQAVASPEGDLATPMKGPFVSQRGGCAERHRAAIKLTKSARLLPAAILVDTSEALDLAAAHGLTIVPVEDASPYMALLAPLHDIIHARVPLAASEAGRVHVFRPDDGGEEHFAIEIGKPDRDAPVLARLHSACFTGDLFGSLKCDCGPQLHAALTHMGTNGSGVLLYLNQEGRGIGHANKMRAYALQDQGYDTVEANHRLGFEDDERDFRIGAAILKEMGFHSVNLMTNNPAKIARMQEQGIVVVHRVPLEVGKNSHNSAYLATKAKKSGHLL
ncbi:GTP cyclohydrolase II [Pacificibacter marinus]|uniref:GTP cyclohydrolase-2 n=1 Tax=Pacificibacter marinus TaxID=658057 RepID=A0A1Y5TGM0_9RHOB|nr:GTP cyclohydrolase II [Pacificibacter marinus]SEL13590.1 GTP cyclohydrolase II [Pacificibacter marinus]SLN61465.1 GTP cyclohydrolase-2 [Pacificibacter marinus]